MYIICFFFFFWGGVRLLRLGKSIEHLFMDPNDWCSNWLRWWNHRCCRSVLAQVYHDLTGVLKHVRIIKRKYNLTFQERLHHLRKKRSIVDMNLSWFIPKNCLTFGSNLFNDLNIQVQYRLQLVAPLFDVISYSQHVSQRHGAGHRARWRAGPPLRALGRSVWQGPPPQVKWP